MAERRMFAKTIIDSDAFLDMPLSTQALYFHLSMRADDDGFINNPKKIQRMIGASDDDLKLLILKRFIIPFESGIVVIKHWKIHNYIRGDRKKMTVYPEEMSRLTEKPNGAYALRAENQGAPGLPDNCQSSDSQMSGSCHTQDRLGKDRLELGEDRIGEDIEEPDDERPGSPAPSHIHYEEIKTLYNDLCPSFSRCTALSDARKKAIKARFSSGYTMEDFKTLFTKAEASSFLKGRNDRNWRASFDWLIKDSNMAKVLDGNYDDHKSGNPGPRGGGGYRDTGFETSNPFLEMLNEERGGR